MLAKFFVAFFYLLAKKTETSIWSLGWECDVGGDDTTLPFKY